ncbi:MAG: hypothetical protein JW840_00340 [Candidatus Thermoplasmatota archaeon]|nr:hypothetical protein [Candidatus Thermoplasmatota archaeon]
MDKRPLIVVSLCAVVLLVLGSLSNVVGYQSIDSTSLYDSPLFRVKIERFLHTQQNKITYRYLGGEKNSDNDTTPPVTTCILKPPHPGYNGWYGSKITVTLNATDDDSGINVTYYQIDLGIWKIYTQPFNITLDGRYLLKYYSVDNAGNTEPEKNITLSLDTKAPRISMNYSWAGNGLCNYVIIYSATATDETSGMNRTEFYFNDVLRKTVLGPGPVYEYEIPDAYTVKGFIFNPEILEEYVKFHARIVMITTYSLMGISMTIKAVAYDNAGWTAEVSILPPTFQIPIIKPGFYLFRDVTLPNNYTGYIGKYFIRATFYNT